MTLLDLRPLRKTRRSRQPWPGRVRRWVGRGLVGGAWVGVVALSATLGAAAIVSPALVAAAFALGLAAVLVSKPGVVAVLAVTVLPLQGLVVPGLPIEASASDLLVVLALVGWGIASLVGPDDPHRTAVVRPIALGLLAYGVAAGATIIAHPTAVAVVTGLQRAFILVGALLLGAVLVRTGRLRPALVGYLLTTSVMSVAALAAGSDGGVLGVQKNPAGGFIAAGLVIAVVLRPTRWWPVLGSVTAVGVVGSQSRGALIGLAVGAVAALLVVKFRDRWRLLMSFAAATVLLLGAYSTLPAEDRTRLRRLSGSSDFAIRYREEFQADATDAFHRSPWLGTGVGNYEGGLRQPTGPGSDPHQVIYFQLAEGGAVLLAGFAVLCAVTIWVALRQTVRTSLAVAALAVQVATLVHALGDVYWVRGTPTPALLLLGAALAAVGYHCRGDTRADGWLLPERDSLTGRRGASSTPAAAPAQSGARTR